MNIFEIQADSYLPTCQKCDRDGIPDEHKGNDVIRCPECEQILFREVV